MNKVMSHNQDKTSQDPIQHREHADRLSNLGNTKPAQINREIGLNLFKDMTLGRRFEDKCAEMYYRGKMFGFVHLYNGQEAISTGVIGAMKRKHDWFCSTYRDHVHALSAGVPCERGNERAIWERDRLQQRQRWIYASIFKRTSSTWRLCIYW